MTKCFEQVRLWHVWRWSCHWDFPRGLLRVILLVFSFQRRVGLWGATSTQTYAAIIAGSVFSCAILHMLFIWPCDCLMSKWPRLRLTKYVDDLTLSYSGRNYTVADTITEATSLLIGWLESGLDFHVSKDENGKEGKSVVLASNRTLKEMLAAKVKPLGMRVVSHARLLGVDSFGAGMARRRKTQYGRLDGVKKRMPKVKFFRKYGAITSKIAKAGFLPSGLHGVRCLGLPPTRVKALRTTPPGQACRTFAHLAPACARVRPDSRLQGRTNCGLGRGGTGRATGRLRAVQGVETTAAARGHETHVESCKWSNRSHYHVSETTGVDVAASHHWHHGKRARNQPARDVSHGCQRPGGGGQ